MIRSNTLVQADAIVRMNAGGRTSRVRLVAERWPDAEGKPSSEAVVSRSAVRGTASSCVVAQALAGCNAGFETKGIVGVDRRPGRTRHHGVAEEPDSRC